MSAIRRELPEGDVEIVDILANCRLWFRIFCVWPYWAMIRYAPQLWKRFFEARTSRNSRSTAPAWAWRFGCGAAFRKIASFHPDLILNCEVGACEVATLARRDATTTAQIINVITDFETEPVWVQPEVAHYAVANKFVQKQLVDWGAPAGSISVVGIPLTGGFGEDIDSESVKQRFGFDDRPIVLLMGGGMGPTNMDMVAAELLALGKKLQIVALPGKDKRAERSLKKILAQNVSCLRIVSWTDEIASLMKLASVLVTKPGGVTLTEAAASRLPMVFFDAIPGPEETNARTFVEAGAAVMTRHCSETALAAEQIVCDEAKQKRMADCGSKIVRYDAAEMIAKIAVGALATDGKKAHANRGRSSDTAVDGPVLIVAISNGSGHLRVARGIAAAIKQSDPGREVVVVDLADQMSRIARFTHVTAYLWLVKNAPSLWGWIDSFQKGQEHTSPEWFYRRHCCKLFCLVRDIRPCAILATEVGCCEVASLIKRDLELRVPLIAVNSDPDVDRAWVQPEVDLYCFPTNECINGLLAHGAKAESVVIWGPALAVGFGEPRNREADRTFVCNWLGLDEILPILIVSGGGEGIGGIEEVVSALLHASINPIPQLIVMAGRNERVKSRCERLVDISGADGVRILGWIDEEQMPKLLGAADLAVSKLGNMFNEAMVCELPLIALEPTPGSETIQYRMLKDWNVGHAVRTYPELIDAVKQLLGSPSEVTEIRRSCRVRAKSDANARIADWLKRAQRPTNRVTHQNREIRESSPQHQMSN